MSFAVEQRPDSAASGETCGSVRVITKITNSAVDKKRRFALFSKGSSLKAERPVGRWLRSLLRSRFEEPRSDSGVPERAAQAECDRVFDNKVERASREMKRGFKSE